MPVISRTLFIIFSTCLTSPRRSRLRKPRIPAAYSGRFSGLLLHRLQRLRLPVCCCAQPRPILPGAYPGDSRATPVRAMYIECRGPAAILHSVTSGSKLQPPKTPLQSCIISNQAPTARLHIANRALPLTVSSKSYSTPSLHVAIYFVQHEPGRVQAGFCHFRPS